MCKPPALCMKSTQRGKIISSLQSYNHAATTFSTKRRCRTECLGKLSWHCESQNLVVNWIFCNEKDKSDIFSTSSQSNLFHPIFYWMYSPWETDVGVMWMKIKAWLTVFTVPWWLSEDSKQTIAFAGICDLQLKTKFRNCARIPKLHFECFNI